MESSETLLRWFFGHVPQVRRVVSTLRSFYGTGMYWYNICTIALIHGVLSLASLCHVEYAENTARILLTSRNPSVLTYTVESKPNKLLVLLRSQLLNL